MTTAQPPEPADLQAMHDRARTLHRAGRLEEARAVYQQLLRGDPDRTDVLLPLGQLFMQMRAPQPAAAVLAHAAQAHPRVAAAHGLLGEALYALGRPAEALASLDRALSLEPNAQAWANRGAVLAALGRREEAVESYGAAVALAPGQAAFHLSQGVALHGLGRHDPALASYDRALALDPSLAEAHNNRGLVLMTAGRSEEALGAFDAAIALRPDYADARHSRAAALLALERPGEALEACDDAIALRPGDPGFHNSRGLALNALRRHDVALAAFERAIALRQDFAEALNNRALALVRLGHGDEALASFEAAIAARPDYAAARYGRAVALLARGDFEEGWREYEWRPRREPRTGPPLDDARQWRGEELGARTLFVHHEQGLGDTIQFARYVKSLAEGGARVTFQVQRPLATLLRQLGPGARIIGQGEPPPPFDLHCPLLSLPLAFGTTVDSIPSPEGYLRADPSSRARFEARLGARTRPRVGLAWSGNPEHENDYNRSIPFEVLAPLLAADVDFVCLQDAVRPSDAAAFERSGRVSFHGGELKDFSDTAGLVDLMDLVISADTSLAHLAGAMAKPVWVLLPFVPDWRWMRRRADSPWYASARLVRQTRIGDWASVIAAIAAELPSAVGRLS